MKLDVDEKTILSLEMNGYKHSSELSWDANMYELLESFFGMCVSATFSPKTVLEVMNEFSKDKLEAFWDIEENSDITDF